MLDEFNAFKDSWKRRKARLLEHSEVLAELEKRNPSRKIKTKR